MVKGGDLKQICYGFMKNLQISDLFLFDLFLVYSMAMGVTAGLNIAVLSWDSRVVRGVYRFARPSYARDPATMHPGRGGLKQWHRSIAFSLSVPLPRPSLLYFSLSISPPLITLSLSVTLLARGEHEGRESTAQQRAVK